MYQAGARQLRPAYGFTDSVATTHPLVTSMSHFGTVSTSIKQRIVSFDTSSKEPTLMRSRVFVGNINTNLISRDEIIRLFSNYGSLLGVTVFKGYAFIQYGLANEADIAVNVLNGYNWNGSVLDVKLAIAGMKTHSSSNVSPTAGMKRNAESWPSAEIKKEKGNGRDIQNERNRQAALEDSTTNDNLYKTGMSDTLICGSCRFVTSDFEEFRNHRRKPCCSTLTNSIDN